MYNVTNCSPAPYLGTAELDKRVPTTGLHLSDKPLAWVNWPNLAFGLKRSKNNKKEKNDREKPLALSVPNSKRGRRGNNGAGSWNRNVRD